MEELIGKLTVSFYSSPGKIEAGNRCCHLGLHMAIAELKDSSSPNQWSNFNLEAVGGGRSGVYPVCGPGSFFTHIKIKDTKEVRVHNSTRLSDEFDTFTSPSPAIAQLHDNDQSLIVDRRIYSRSAGTRLLIHRLFLLQLPVLVYRESSSLAAYYRQQIHVTADDGEIEVRISVGCTEGDKPLNQSLHCLYRTRTGENPFASRKLHTSALDHATTEAGSDEASKDTATAINNLEVSSKLESDDFIAIKLDNQIVPVPSLFFIGSAGAPLEVVAGKVSVSDLVLRVDGVLQKHRSSTPSLPKPLESPAQSISALESKPSTSGSPHPSETESSITSEANISLSTTSPPETTPDVSVGSTLSVRSVTPVASILLHDVGLISHDNSTFVMDKN
uniref:Uncharacterized protein n=1 Tax=Timema poppense TaxID=170557 RepID=A0A7R9H364_TIMPO|nr:unnamed protein product [Timema poppensis]